MQLINRFAAFTAVRALTAVTALVIATGAAGYTVVHPAEAQAQRLRT